MHQPTIDVFDKPDFGDIIQPDETVLWSGKPEYGLKFRQAIGAERTIHISLLLGAVAMWCTLPLISTTARFNRLDAVFAYLATSIGFMLFSAILASHRQHILNSLAYFVTTKRTIICRRGRNGFLAERLYVISCPHVATYPYEVLDTRPYPSLQVGILLSQELVQPLGFGLGHPGQSPLWGRTTADVVLEYIPNADELLAKIRECLPDPTADAS